MTHQSRIGIGVTMVVALGLVIAIVMHRPPAHSSAAASHIGAPQDCAGVWSKGVELAGTVGKRKAEAYFDTRTVPGTPHRISGIVRFPDERKHEALADTPIGLAGPPADSGCTVQLQAPDGGSEKAVWQIGIENTERVTGTRRMPDGHAEAIVLRIVPETPCDGAGEWRTFTSPQWPITFDYPANWVLTDDEDDVNVECPSMTHLAAGGRWLTFERGRFPPAHAQTSVTSAASFSEPYWFVRRSNDDWRVNDDACAGRTGPRPLVPCAPARRSARNGITMLQGAAGDHRLYRAGIGYLGEGRGITRYLFVLGEEWVSLDSGGANGHYDDVGGTGGPVLLDGEAVGDRLVRSIRRR